jgi:hypothetical protein
VLSKIAVAGALEGWPGGCMAVTCVSGYLFSDLDPKLVIKIKSFEWDGYNSALENPRIYVKME